MLRYFFILFLALIQPSVAEYRVFELEITSYADNGNATPTEAASAMDPAKAPVAGTPLPSPEETGKKTVFSTLDPSNTAATTQFNPMKRSAISAPGVVKAEQQVRTIVLILKPRLKEKLQLRLQKTSKL